MLFAAWSVARAMELLAKILPYLRKPAVFAAFAIYLLAAGMAIMDWNDFRKAHSDTVRIIFDRHVQMGAWVKFNTPSDALIATNIPGTLRYYGGRAVLDMKGAVSPDVFPLIGDLPGLVSLLDQRRVSFIVTTREEFEVVNINPLVSSDINQPGIIEAFRYVPTRTHIMSQSASALNMDAVSLMQEQRLQAAANVLERSLREDPVSSRTLTLLAITRLQMQDTTAAIGRLREALREHPHYAPAMVPLGDLLVARQEWEDGISLLEEAVRLFPQSEQAKSSLQAARDALKKEEERKRGVTTYSFTIEQ